ncbi:MAG: PadR family transcriptional regulator [Clostridia bacterium]|nr:PadR family transcriptional regulator [Clostridia bacterium]
MDIQLKRGILEVCVLKALEKQDSYGYQIIKDLSPFVLLSESTLYPILRRIEAAGCVTVYSVEHNGRLRKYYHLTPAGQARILGFLNDWNEVVKAYDFIRGNDDEKT